MVKQIEEQVKTLCRHVSGGAIDINFVALHAAHLSQLADSGLAGNYAQETSAKAAAINHRREEFMRLIGF
ncbi:MAG: hypothetical protein ACYC96_06405 [Fimbriimonadaceae bacterium]